jgi:hypothetical protein
MAGIAGRQAEFLAAHLRSLITGEGEPSAYEPMLPGIAVPLGPQGGAGQFPGSTDVVGAKVVSEVKGQHLMADRTAELFDA